MPTVSEAVDTSLPPIGALLSDGIDQFLYQEVTFTKYVRVILPLDGFVFWVKAGLLSDSSLIGSGATNTASTITAKGAIHSMSSQGQDEDATYATNDMVFTTVSEIYDFNLVSNNELYIGSHDGLRFAFNTRGMYSPNAKLYHYTGIAVLPIMESQIIDDVTGFDTSSLVVSNSLPLWLAMNGYEKKNYETLDNKITLYPSFLVPTNVTPPYGVVHNLQETVVGVSAISVFDKNGSSSQLVMEHVRITLYGVRNNGAVDFLNFVRQYSLNTDDFGISNIPIIRDDKRIQSELSLIAQRKIIEFDINYYQSRVMDVSRQLIKSAVPTYSIQSLST
jgi:hypothetical protein